MFRPWLLPAFAWIALCAYGIAAAGESPGLGQEAPAFRLRAQNTPGCTTEACEFRDNIFAFRDAGAVILGISVDDVDSHKQFSTEHKLPFPILADSTRQVAKSYGVLHRALGLIEVARRETFLIDPRAASRSITAESSPKATPGRCSRI